MSSSPAPRSSLNAWLVAALLVAIAALLYRGGEIFQRDTNGPLHNPDAQPRPIVARGDLAQDETSTIELFRTVSPSVVFITRIDVRRDMLNLNLMEIPSGTGTGFIWDGDGHVVTNFHVIGDIVNQRIDLAEAAVVTLEDGSEWRAKLVGYALNKDLAVLKIDAPPEKLIPIQVGRSDNLLVGQKVFAIGNPFGLDQTLTTGVISGLGREIKAKTGRPIQGVIQTDAAINPGNSGGPLLDSAGLLIGVNTAIFSPTRIYAGIGFAVPVDTVNRIVPQLIRTGRVTRAGLGVELLADNIFAELRRRGLLEAQNGAMIRTTRPEGSAEKAGLRGITENEEKIVWGDIIFAIDGIPITQIDDIFRALDQRDVGETVEVQFLRDDEEMQATVELQELTQQ
ncbi:S1C family serine protease [Calycomorphotria hydatis]|uniref:Periplasmic serine endoprotease DegP n=1 Tax=Calycomorphotria hydatis TaxID=2528027 RepID=A0A517TC44_9PLAN|nr:trypsin-like peptidase domain-containing protein [Calycomorphotria hydatis]QDT65941.1 Periplasmic serine endoprotease DegP precursor [Calycomorphotria hydatis]